MRLETRERQEPLVTCLSSKIVNVNSLLTMYRPFGAEDGALILNEDWPGESTFQTIL